MLVPTEFLCKNGVFFITIFFWSNCLLMTDYPVQGSIMQLGCFF